MFRPRLLLGSALLLLTLTGFGCRKPGTLSNVAPLPSPSAAATNTQPTKPASAPTPTPLPNTKPPVKKLDPSLAYLRQVFQNFSNVTSFRSEFTTPVRDATATGTIEFVKNKGLHGSLALPGPLQVEIIILGDALYFRSGTSTWINLGASTEGKQISALFQSAFSLNQETANTILTDSTVILDQHDDPQGCRLYTLQPSLDSKKTAAQICVQNDLPVRISTLVNGQVIEMRYRDFNQPISIIAPK